MNRWFSLALLLTACNTIPAFAAQERVAIEGRVISTNGLPIPNATVSIYFAVPREEEGKLCPTCYPEVDKRTQTDAQGAFRLDSLSPDLRFRLLVTAKGYRPEFIKNVDPLFSSALARLTPLRIAPGPPEQRVTGKCFDADGKPLSGVVINVGGTRNAQYSSYGSASGRADSMAVSDEKGEFSINCAKDITALSITAEPRAASKRRFWLETGKAHIVRLKPGTTLTGRLLSEGEAVPGANLTMSTQERESSVYMSGFDGKTTRNGRFTISHVPANTRFLLHTRMKDMRGIGMSLPNRLVETTGDGSNLDLGDLSMQPAHMIAGRVVLSDRKPIPSRTRIYVGLDDANDSQDQALGPDGEFQFDGVPVGGIDFSIRITGYRVSAKNPNKDWLNEGRLVGRLEGDLDNFVIHLEPGARSNENDAPPDADRQPRTKPLQGAKL